MIPNSPKALRKPGLLLGIGMGGFIDGILFHQILQIHSMLSNRFFPNTVVNLEINMVWDGLFHLFTWITTAIGIAFLWRAGRNPRILWSGKYFLGALAMGWGLFNLIEGIIDHHILEVHHVVQRAAPDQRLLWDLLFDLSGVALIVLGWYLMGAVLKGENAPSKEKMI
jgi:uncharacterized membrane protein